MKIKRIELSHNTNLIKCFDGFLTIEIEQELLGIKTDDDLISFIQAAGGIDAAFKLISYKVDTLNNHSVH